MTDRLRALAVALLARLGLLLVSLGEPRSWTPLLVLVAALVTAWVPWRSLGLPGKYTPQTGGMP